MDIGYQPEHLDSSTQEQQDRQQRKQAAEEILKKNLGEGIQIEYGFPITEERDAQGNVIDAEIVWVRFSDSEGQEKGTLPVEAKIYFPRQAGDESGKSKIIVLFVPGYPGGASGRFESTYAPEVVGRGNIFCVARRNSKPFNEDESEMAKVFNSPRRIADARADGQKYMGPDIPEGYTLQELLNEPVPALQALGKQVDEIKLVGNSFGTTCLYNTVDHLRQNNPKIAEKITHLISLAGYLVGDEEDSFWHSAKMDLNHLEAEEVAIMQKDGVHFNLPKYRESLLQLAKQMKDIKIPAHILQTIVCAVEDPLITLPLIKKISAEGDKEIIEFTPFPGHEKRTLMIEDYTPHKKPHTLSGLTPKTLTRLLEMRGGRGTHFVKVGIER